MSLAVLDRKHTIAPPGYNRWLVSKCDTRLVL